MSQLLSDGTVVTDNSNSIMQTGSNIGDASVSLEGETNLTVIANIEDMVGKLNEMNEEYKTLLKKDASAISAIQTTYEELDTNLKGIMGLEY